MIIRYLSGGRALVDRQALVCETGLSEVTIRSRLHAATYDTATGRALYDHDQAAVELAGVIPWPEMQNRKRRRSA